MLKRFSVSLEEQLLDRFDGYLGARGYANRSEAIRDLIRKVLIGEEWERDSEVVGVVTLNDVMSTVMGDLVGPADEP